MANIVLKTFAAGDDGQGTVTPQDDALIYQNAIPMNGIFSGATVTLSEANVLHVAAGFGIIGGRFFEINESDVTVELSSSGTLLGRLYIHLELTNADVPININVATGASLPALVGDPDLNINDGAFDLELATFNVSEVTISDIVNTFPIISKANNQLRRATAYSINDMVLCQSASDSLIFICTTAGTTAVSEPTGYATITDGNTITDGTAVFKAVSVSGTLDNIASKADQSLLAPVLNTLVAPAGGLASGDQFVYNGLLYKATAAIAQGRTITINGNCALADSVTKQIGLITNAVGPLYYLFIPYDASYYDNIIGLLNKAMQNNMFKNGVFIGEIDPSGRAAMLGIMYIAENMWYGNVSVIYSNATLSGIYTCSANVWSKIQ